ncbi:MAG: DsrE family protein [Promethearchaeota archaeon]
MKSVLILTNSGPLGSNSAYEAIRLGAGFLGLGSDIDCKIVLYGDAVLLMKNNLQPANVGMDSMEEGVEMADLTDMPLCVVKEDLSERGISPDELTEYDSLELIDRSAIPDLMGQFGAVFHI